MSLMGSVVVTTATGLPLGKLVLPPGFKIEFYADDVTNARQMALGDDGTGVRRQLARLVHAVVDDDGDYVADWPMK